MQRGESYLRRALLYLIASAAAVIAYTLLSFALASSGANAAEEAEERGLLNSLTSSTLTSSVTEVVNSATGRDNSSLEPINDLAAVVDATVVAPATEALRSAPVSQVTEPLLDEVASVPVVSALVDDTVKDVGAQASKSVDRVLANSADTVDHLGGSAAGVIDGVGEAVEVVTGKVEAVVGGVVNRDEENEDSPGVLPTRSGATAGAEAQVATANERASLAANRYFHAQADAPTAPNVLPQVSNTAKVPLSPSTSPPATAPNGTMLGSGGGSGVPPACDLENHHTHAQPCAPSPGNSHEALPTSPVFEADISPD